MTDEAKPNIRAPGMWAIQRMANEYEALADQLKEQSQEVLKLRGLLIAREWTINAAVVGVVTRLTQNQTSTRLRILGAWELVLRELETWLKEPPADEEVNQILQRMVSRVSVMSDSELQDLLSESGGRLWPLVLQETPPTE